MKTEKNVSQAQKLMKKAIQVSFGSSLLEWPPHCYLFDYQPHRPEKALPNGPSRKYYTITEHGRETLSEYWKSWQQVCELVSTVFQKGAPYE